jgi:hypothetical protein
MKFHANNMNGADLFVGKESYVNDVIALLKETNSFHNAYTTYKEKYVKEKNNDFIEPYYVSMGASGNAMMGVHDLVNSLNPIKKYNYKDVKHIGNKFSNFLLPPYGDNLFAIVDHNKELRKEISDIFNEYGLEFVGYKKESKFEIEKKVDGYVNKYHLSSVADTFLRLIFYFAAIDSNKDSILILEEPEVHSFPPYTKQLSDRIIDSKENQFFITTHSPYLLQNLISNLDSSELNVFITYFENYQTKIKKLSDKELKQASDFSVDLFYNLSNFVKNA